MSDKPRAMFQNACTYSKIAGLLNGLFDTGIRGGSECFHDLGLPSCVNAALALELFFKTLYFLERNKDFKDKKGRHSHDFHALYLELEDERKETIQSLFDQKLSIRNMSDVEGIEREISMSVPRDLVGNLEMWKDVFVKFRYAYELREKNRSLFFFPEIEDSVAYAILELRLDLDPIYHARRAMDGVQIVPYH